MDAATDRSLAELRAVFERDADPARAAEMARYMRGRFDFFGIATPVRRRLARPFVAARRDESGSVLLDVALALWDEPERELQYVAVDLLRRWERALSSEQLPGIEQLIRNRSWWDTVDAIAARVVGPLVAREPALVGVMDAWIDDDDVWIARTAILHQLSAGPRTDAERLFRYVDRRAADEEFFLRKASGWALRQYARTDPGAVRAYLAGRGDRLSGLTRREAAKHL